MKYLTNFILALFALALILGSCNKRAGGVVLSSAPNIFKFVSLDEDTISTSSSVDTVDFTIGTFNSPVSYEIQISADSLSGATDATAYVEYQAATSGSDWVSIDQATINGVTTRDLETGSILGGRLRVRIISGSGTQSTTVRAAAVIAGRDPN